jgi:hypothetical protein
LSLHRLTQRLFSPCFQASGRRLSDPFSRFCNRQDIEIATFRDQDCGFQETKTGAENIPVFSHLSLLSSSLMNLTFTPLVGTYCQ